MPFLIALAICKTFELDPLDKNSLTPLAKLPASPKALMICSLLRSSKIALALTLPKIPAIAVV